MVYGEYIHTSRFPSYSARRQLRVARSVHEELDISDVVVSIQVADTLLGTMGLVRKSPCSWGCGSPSKWPNFMAFPWGLLTTYLTNWVEFRKVGPFLPLDFLELHMGLTWVSPF